MMDATAIRSLGFIFQEFSKKETVRATNIADIEKRKKRSLQK